MFNAPSIMKRVFKYTAAFGFLLLFPFKAEGFVVDTPNYGDYGGNGGKNGAVIIVIDAGHGGKDVGATGPGGAKEKDVNLNIAMALAQELTEKTGAKVVLTRTDDSFIPLKERPQIANRENADIFISIHSNSSRIKDIHGAETYFLNPDASDDDARMLALFENDANDKDRDGRTSTPEGEDVKSILWDMTQSETNRESGRLAERIHESLVKTTGDGRGVKQAPFAVLVGAAMPAVLIEIGYLSNPQEEKTLTKEETQKLIASSIAAGIAEFEQKIKKKTAGRVKPGSIASGQLSGR